MERKIGNGSGWKKRRWKALTHLILSDRLKYPIELNPQIFRKNIGLRLERRQVYINPGPVVALCIGQRIPMVEQRIDNVGDCRIFFANDLSRRSHDNGSRWNDGALGNKRISSYYGSLADYRTIHDDAADADQAIVLDRAAMQNGTVSNRAIVSDNCGMTGSDMYHHKILDVGETADLDLFMLRPNDAVGPDATSLFHPDFSEHDSGGSDICRVLDFDRHDIQIGGHWRHLRKCDSSLSDRSR